MMQNVREEAVWQMLDANYIKGILLKLGLEERFITDQTANCVIALYERNERLRIHDIIEFMRKSLGKTVAENTRESIRKSSMKRLVNIGAVIVNEDDPSRPINSGKTNYKLTDAIRRILSISEDKVREQLIQKWVSSHYKVGRTVILNEQGITVNLPDGSVKTMSPGIHNQIIKSILEIFIPRYLDDAEVLYIGDARKKLFYVNKAIINRLGLVIDEHDKLPDVMIWSTKKNALYAIESVTSGGPIEEQRREEINYIINEKPKKTLVRKGKPQIQIGYVSAFPDRKTFSKYSSVIAWGTDVWIASEPSGVIRYQHSGKTIYIEI